MKNIEPQIQTFKLAELKPAVYNPRTITAEAMAGLTASIEKFGYIQPIVVNVRSKKNIIIGGNQRYRILQKLHSADYECLCVTVSLGRADEKLLNITLNNPKVQGEFIKELGAYIDKLRKQLPNDTDFLDLRIKELRDGIKQINFEPIDENIRLDQLEPQIVRCPKCGHEFDARKQS